MPEPPEKLTLWQRYGPASPFGGRAAQARHKAGFLASSVPRVTDGMQPGQSVEEVGLDTPLVQLSDTDIWRVKDAFEGTQIFGATGSGKSSGSGAAIALRMLRLGFGGLILTVKADEPDTWMNAKNGYCVQEKREGEVIRIEQGGDQYFDFLQYESERGSDTLQLTELFMTVLEAGRGSVGGSDPYWSNALNQLIANTIDLAQLSMTSLSLRGLSAIVSNAPQSIAETQAEAWLNVVRAAKHHATGDEQKRDLAQTLDYFNGEFPRLGDRLRSSIVSLFTASADRLLRGTVGTIFSGGKVTVRPEDTHEGKIILVNLPTKQYGETGRLAQMIFKYVWQRAAERRDKSKPMRPLFLWCDESQELVTGLDAAFQATARSSRVATVYLTQNIRNYHARMGGGAKAEAETDSLLGNLGTKIFHANGDPTTNQYAERVFGYGPSVRRGGSVSGGGVSSSWNDSTEPVVPAKRFTMLRKGSKDNNRQVDAIVSQVGRTWEATKNNYLETVFEQPAE